MKIESLVIGKKYRSTAFKSPVTLIEIGEKSDSKEYGEVAVLTISYRGKEYFDFNFSLSEV